MKQSINFNFLLFVWFTILIPISSYLFPLHPLNKIHGRYLSKQYKHHTQNVLNPYSLSKELQINAIKGVDTYDSSFTLTEEMEESLLSLLTHDDMINEVKKNAKSLEASFTGLMFQPVPYSSNTPYGMPQEFEKYYHDKDNYVVCNIPPFFMFKAKIFKPSRLCAIYHIKGKEDFSFSKNRDGSEEETGKTPTMTNSNEEKKRTNDAVWKDMGQSLRQLMIDQTQEEDDDESFDYEKYII